MKFNLSYTPSVIDLAVDATRDNPGPGSFDLSNDARVKPAAGGAFNLYTPASDLDLVIARSKLTPGPGQYNWADQDRKVVTLDRTVMSYPDAKGK